MCILSLYVCVYVKTMDKRKSLLIFVIENTTVGKQVCQFVIEML